MGIASRTPKLLIVIVFLCIFQQATSAQTCRHAVRVRAFENTGIVHNLSPGDLVATVDGKSVPIATVEFKPLAPRIVLAVDHSGSMASSADSPNVEWTWVQRAAEEVINSAPPASPIALVFFADEIEDTANFGTGREALVQFVMAEQPKGKTSLWDALAASRKIFSEHHDGDVIIAISDGGDNQSHEKYEAVSKDLTLSGIPFFGLLMTVGQPRTEEEREGPINFGNLAEMTGGVSPLVSLVQLAREKPDVANNTLHALVSTLHSISANSHVVHFDAPESSRPEKLRLKFTQRLKQRKATLLYPHLIGPCVTPPSSPSKSETTARP